LNERKTALETQFDRIYPILGEAGVEKLRKAHVLLVGVGGVGSAAGEALVRGGIGSITVADMDTVNVTNINRQLIATHSTIGKKKVVSAYERYKDIAPDCNIYTLDSFYSEENPINLEKFDYVIDCIDSVRSKLFLIESAHKAGVPIISCMGTGNKLDPTRLEVSDISKTSVCPLAKVIRVELRKKGINHLKVVYSKEQPVINTRTPASLPFVPPVAGFIMAGEVIKDIAEVNKQ
jgi:tRNA A37 threonylcarbamoyladenosine dehydratase